MREDRAVDMTSGHPDLELAGRAGRGDEAAWRTIYDQTCGPLFNFLCYQTGDRDAACDLLQETYVVALEKLGTYRGQGSLAGWLRAVALRRALDWRRRVSLRLKKMAAFATDGTFLADANAQETFPGLGDGFQRALDRLSPRQRAALLLRELEDQAFADIAAALGCGEATARVHYHRACRNMKSYLDESEGLVFRGNAEEVTP